MRAGFAVSCLSGTIALAVIAGSPAVAGPPPAVAVSENSASIDTFQALNAVDTRSRDKFGSDFTAFGESLHPAVLRGPEGRADAFVSLAATVVTPSATTPFDPVRGIGMSGRLLDEARKTTNPAPGVPVASSEGDFSVDFQVNDPTRTQFAGALRAANSDENDCTEVLVELSGPVSRTFEVAGGGDCPSGLPRSRGFVLTQVFPVGSYAVDVEYGTTVDPEDPGTETASAAVDVSVGFLPPDTRITAVRIRPAARPAGDALARAPGSGKATFGFKATGGRAKGFQCALAPRGRKLKFRRCDSPKTYRNLDPGRYQFAVRAIGPVAPDATPAKRRFRID